MNQGKLLTEQFYAWEERGRGHTLVNFPALLEPPFVPFFGHFLDIPYIDDGVRPTFGSALKRLFIPDHSVHVPVQEPDKITAYPDVEDPDLTIFEVTLPMAFASKGDSLEQCLIMFGLCQETIAFELIATRDSLTILITCRDSSASFVYTQLLAYFPDSTITETYEDAVLETLQAAPSIVSVDFGLREDFMRPIAAVNSTGHDPYTSLFSTFAQLAEGEAVILQVLFAGVCNAWAKNMTTAVTDERGGSFFTDAPEMPQLTKEKCARPLFGVTVRLVAVAEYRDDACEIIEHSAAALTNASASPHNSLVMLATPEYVIADRLTDVVMRQSHRVGMLLNTRELATLAHVPPAALCQKLIKHSRTTKQAPRYLHNQAYLLGLNEHQGSVAPVGIDTVQRLKHVHVIGGTGMGKSTLLHSLIAHDIERAIGCCVLDPHGDLIDAVLASIPPHRVQDVVLIDPSDSEHPVGFNILSAHSDLERELLASDLVALFKRFSTSWGDQLHSVLANALMAFLYNMKPGHIGDLRKFLIEQTFRTTVLATCTDSDLVYYWQKEYPLLKTSSIGSILTRLDSFLRPKVIRNMVCQYQGLDIASLMDTNKIILVKLSLGLIGVENSYLLGAVIVAKLQQAALSRQLQAAHARVPFFCYIDEFHHFVTPSMQTILSGARKYSLGLVLAHQDLNQIKDADIASSLMANAGTRICFRLSDTDGKRMQEGFSAFTATDLQNLAVGEAIARVNTAYTDFNLSVMPNMMRYECAADVVAHSRKLYSVPIAARVQPEPTPVTERATPVIADSPTSAIPLSPPLVQEQSLRNTHEHRYLQTLIKSLAEQHGYRAQLEVPTAEKGQIDVVLVRNTERIAIEISVSTQATWEAHNIKKCIADGFTDIVLCASSEAKIRSIKSVIERDGSVTKGITVRFITPEQIPTLFTAIPPPSGQTVMKGYRVKVNYSKSTNDAQGIVKEIIKRGKKH